jgi:hypothetical protein
MLDKNSSKASPAASAPSGTGLKESMLEDVAADLLAWPMTMQPGAEVPADRRESPRHRAVMRAARLSSCVHKVEGMGIVRNISEGGMLVQSHLSFENGEHVVISLLDGDRIEGEVVWQDGTAFGIQFCSWISVDMVLAKPDIDRGKLRPRAPRLTIDRPILLRSGSYLADARLCDISQRGAKIRFSKYLAIDCRLQISSGDMRPIGGSVKWQVGDFIGLEFHRTLSINELTSWSVR